MLQINNNDNTADHSHQPCCSSTAASLPCLPRLLLFPPPPRSPPPPPPPLPSFVLFRHFLILHFFLWMVSGQGLPPNCGSNLIIRVRMVCPLPQDLLHSDHSDHSETMQSTAGREKIVHVVNFCYKVQWNTRKCTFQVMLASWKTKWLPPWSRQNPISEYSNLCAEFWFLSRLHIHGLTCRFHVYFIISEILQIHYSHFSGLLNNKTFLLSVTPHSTGCHLHDIWLYILTRSEIRWRGAYLKITEMQYEYRE